MNSSYHLIKVNQQEFEVCRTGFKSSFQHLQVLRLAMSKLSVTQFSGKEEMEEITPSQRHKCRRALGWMDRSWSFTLLWPAEPSSWGSERTMSRQGWGAQEWAPFSKQQDPRFTEGRGCSFLKHSVTSPNQKIWFLFSIRTGNWVGFYLRVLKWKEATCNLPPTPSSHF